MRGNGLTSETCFPASLRMCTACMCLTLAREMLFTDRSWSPLLEGRRYQTQVICPLIHSKPATVDTELVIGKCMKGAI